MSPVRTRSGAVVVVLLLLSLLAPADAHAPTYDLLSVDGRERPADAATSSADVSRTGRYVVFASAGRNLSNQDPTANEWAEDIYLRDRRKGTTQLVSRATNGKPATGGSPSISPSGRFIAFCSYDKLVKPDEFEFVGFERFLDVFVRDLRSGVTRRASTTHDGKMADEASCGAHVANNGDTVFSSQASNLLRRDLDEGKTRTYLFDWSSRASPGSATRVVRRTRPTSPRTAAWRSTWTSATGLGRTATAGRRLRPGPELRAT